jgi:hypothetical protein
MPESESEKLPQIVSSQELVDFFETHDMGEYESQMPEVAFEINFFNGHACLVLS